IRSLAALVLVAGSCLSAAPRTAHAQKKERDRIAREELLASNQADADLYSALRNLRPRFMEPPRGVRSLGNAMQSPTAVYVDGKYMGDLETLHTIPSNTVDDVRYLEPTT